MSTAEIKAEAQKAQKKEQSVLLRMGPHTRCSRRTVRHQLFQTAPEHSAR